LAKTVKIELKCLVNKNYMKKPGIIEPGKFNTMDEPGNESKVNLKVCLEL